MSENREQRRKAKKLSKKEQNIIQNKKNPLVQKLLKETKEHPPHGFRNGELVELKVDNIVQNKNFTILQPEYQDFITKARGKKFHVLKLKDHENLVCLLEDTTRPRWLFWTGDIKKVKQ